MNTFILIKHDGTREKVPFLLQKGMPYVSPHMARHEVADKWTGDLVIFDPLVRCFEEARRLLGHPIGINSGYRTASYQKHLTEIGYKTAEDSPHCRGAALDLAIPVGTNYLALTSMLKQAARNLGLPKPRLGFKAYGYTFVHVDFVFMLFTPFTVEKNPHPEQWREGAQW